MRFCYFPFKLFYKKLLLSFTTKHHNKSFRYIKRNTQCIELEGNSQYHNVAATDSNIILIYNIFFDKPYTIFSKNNNHNLLFYFKLTLT